MLKFDGLEIIPEQHQVFVNDKEVILTGKEFQILMLLAKTEVVCLARSRYMIVYGTTSMCMMIEI